MGIITTLSITGMVVALMIKVLAGFPVLDGASPGPEAPVSESYSVEAVEQAGGMFSNKFTALIDEMVAFQKDPDYQRAESRRQEMVAAGTAAATMFQDFGNQLQTEFDTLTGQLEEEPVDGTAP